MTLDELKRVERRLQRDITDIRARLEGFGFAPFAAPNSLWAGSGKAGYGGQIDQFADWGGGQGSWGLPGLPGAQGFGGSAGPSTQ
jgi:hypothetical protein